MMRWERENYDAALDGAAVKGEPCPWCGDASLDGSGPCSEACEEALVTADTERPVEADPPLPGEDCLRLATRGAYSRRERGQ